MDTICSIFWLLSELVKYDMCTDERNVDEKNNDCFYYFAALGRAYVIGFKQIRTQKWQENGAVCFICRCGCCYDSFGCYDA